MSSLKCSDHKKLGKLICATDFKSLIWHKNVQVENLALSYSDKVFLGVSPSIDHSTCPKWEIDFLCFSLHSLSEAN